ncbi:uncharacterized protein LOC123695425 [Colias croceus]|uniref:uncharacterized protein LOC123695425 n=1 Tax=Colias crocea TaxID=72248 RepID=UPI001E27AA58|nr:uncharacterized protein LOC123695425 [Colias croceus]
MPLSKNFLFELSIFIAVVAVTGHLTTHFWDRYFFHNEISHMKTSLHVLKHTILDIGAAYDSLHKELNEIAKLERRKSCAVHHHHDEQHHRHLDRRKQHDMNVLA